MLTVDTVDVVSDVEVVGGGGMYELVSLCAEIVSVFE